MIKFVDTFPSHLFIEMCYGRENRFGFIYEQNLLYNDFKRLCESYGLFNNCDKIAEIIYEKCSECDIDYIDTFSMKIDGCNFIERINVQLIDGSISSYIVDGSVINKNKKFDPLVLHIGMDSRSSLCKSSIMHELTHAYEDYNRNIENAQALIKKAKNIGYDKNPISMSNFYGKIKRRVSYILYHLTDFERNGYIAQIQGELSSNKDYFHDISEVLEFIKSTIPYRNYKTIFQYSEELCNENDVEKQKQILMYVNDLSNNDFRTYNQFTKWLTNRILRYQKKFNNIIPKIAAQYINMAESFHNPLISLIE